MGKRAKECFDGSIFNLTLTTSLFFIICTFLISRSPLILPPSSSMHREGPEIYSDSKVNYTDAILGATVKVATVDGDVDIKVPPGTQPGQVMRIKGKGAPRLGNKDVRGDHFVTVTVDIPKKITDKERKLIEELRGL